MDESAVLPSIVDDRRIDGSQAASNVRPIEVEYPVDWPLEGIGAELGIVGWETEH